jgi:hypothetical protein
LPSSFFSAGGSPCSSGASASVLLASLFLPRKTRHGDGHLWNGCGGGADRWPNPRDDWFGSHFIVLCAAAAVIGLVGTGVWELFQKEPIINLGLFLDSNFAMATLLCHPTPSPASRLPRSSGCIANACKLRTVSATGRAIWDGAAYASKCRRRSTCCGCSWDSRSPLPDCLAVGTRSAPQRLRPFPEQPRSRPRHGTRRVLSVLSMALYLLSGFTSRPFPRRRRTPLPDILQNSPASPAPAASLGLTTLQTEVWQASVYLDGFMASMINFDFSGVSSIPISGFELST